MKSSWYGRRGVVLLFTIAILSILAILATCFAQISRMERDVSRNYVDLVRAKFLAQAGIERAVQEVRNVIQGNTIAAVNYSNAEDVMKPWIYGKPMSGGTVFYEPSIPLDKAIFCSMSWNATTNSNRTVKLIDRTNQKSPTNNLDDGYANNDFGVSGFLAGSYTGSGDFYSLKIVDCPSKIYINGPDSNDDNPNPAVAVTVTRLQDNVVNLLNNLSVILNQDMTRPPAQRLVFNDLGTRISNLRVAERRNFMRLEEIVAALGNTTAQQQAALAIIRPYVTTGGWMDAETLAPESLEHGGGGRSTADPNIIYSPGWRTSRTVGLPNERNRRTADATIPDGPARQYACPTTSGSDRHVSNIPGRWMTGMNPGASQTPAPGAPPNMEFRSPRCPVNVNTASVEVLQAVLADLRGGYLNRQANPTTYLGNGWDNANTVTIAALPVNGGLANRIANAIVQRRNELVNASNRGYGFASWYDFYSFIDAIDNAAALGQLVPSSAVAAIPLDANRVRAQAMKDTIKANANPNSHINKFNPDRAFGSRYGDTDKADLTRWTTEFCFNSTGWFEIESMGRVCDRPDGAGAMPIVAESLIRTSVKLFEVYRVSTQKGFIANQTGGSGAAPLVTYPEHMTDIGGATPSSRTAAAADYDGYLMLDTVDNGEGQGTLSFFANYVTDFGADAAGPAEQGTSLVYATTGGNPGMGGQSELFTDGFFNHRTRRYTNYTSPQSPNAWGAPNIGPIDDYIRNGRADSKISLANGTIDMWVKPPWSATGNSGNQFDPSPDFATQNWNSVDNPCALSRRTLFSIGEGTNGTRYNGMAGGNYTNLEVCDNRIYIMAMYDAGGVYMFGSQVTRLCNVPNGLIANWYKTLDAGPHRIIDRSGGSRNHYNGRLLRSDVAADSEPKYSVSQTTWNPRGWRYAGGWHHVRYCWSGETARIFVDGQPGADDPLTGFHARNATNNPDYGFRNNWSIFVGSNRFKDDETNGYPCNADVTIDAVKIYPTAISSSGFIPPQRYVANGSYEGRLGPRTNILDAVVQPVNGAGRLASVAWTVWTPRFSGTPTSCTVEIGKSGQGFTPVTPVMPSPPQQPPIAPELAGRGTRVQNLSLLPGEQITYRVTMTSGTPDQIASPIFDDITVMFITSSPRFLYYSME